MTAPDTPSRETPWENGFKETIIIGGSAEEWWTIWHGKEIVALFKKPDDARSVVDRLAAKPADDGVREATIEECAQIAEWELGSRRSKARVVAAIRALSTKAKP